MRAFFGSKGMDGSKGGVKPCDDGSGILQSPNTEWMSGGRNKSLKGEDRWMTMSSVIVGEQVEFALVADGHGGKTAAVAVCDTFVTRVLALASDASASALDEAVSQVYQQVHDEVCETCGCSGTTLTVIAFNIARGELQAWNVGDSLALLVHDDGHAVISKSFRLADNPEEQERVVGLGAKLGRALNADGLPGGPLRAWPGGLAGALDPFIQAAPLTVPCCPHPCPALLLPTLTHTYLLATCSCAGAVTRTIGDNDCKNFVSAEPYHVAPIVPPNGGAVVICSDGVWDHLRPESVAQIVLAGGYSDAKSAATRIVKSVIKKNGGVSDDTTAVVCLFGARVEEPHIPWSRRSEPTGRSTSFLAGLTALDDEKDEVKSNDSFNSKDSSAELGVNSKDSKDSKDATVNEANVGTSILSQAHAGVSGSRHRHSVRYVRDANLSSSPIHTNNSASVSTEATFGGSRRPTRILADRFDKLTTGRDFLCSDPDSRETSTYSGAMFSSLFGRGGASSNGGTSSNSTSPTDKRPGGDGASATFFFSRADAEQSSSPPRRMSTSPVFSRPKTAPVLPWMPWVSRASGDPQNFVPVDMTVVAAASSPEPKAPTSSIRGFAPALIRTSQEDADPLAHTIDALATEAHSATPRKVLPEPAPPSVPAAVRTFSKRASSRREAKERIVAWEELGAGGEAMTFLGCGEFANAHRTTFDGQVVAVKRLKQQKIASQDALVGLKREIMLMTMMRHPNVLKGLAIGQTDGQPFMVMELLTTALPKAMPRDASVTPFWVRWRELREWPQSRSLKYSTELAKALRYCHHEAFPGTRVLHRDIKPNNIGILADDTLVLFDFGLASLWSTDNDAGVYDDTPRKLTGETGSLRYMSPEVALSRPYNYKAEVFSYASVVWEMLAFRKPFEDLSVEVFYKAIDTGHRPPLPKKWPPTVCTLLAQCWQHAPASRPEFNEIVPRLEAIKVDMDNEDAKKMAKKRGETIKVDMDNEDAKKMAKKRGETPPPSQDLPQPVASAFEAAHLGA